MSEPTPCPFCNSTAAEKNLEQVNGYWAAELLKARTDSQTLRTREAVLKARNERLEKALELESKRLDWVMQYPMIYHHKIFMECCGGYEAHENKRFREAIDKYLTQEAKAVL
jgi:hypothetical protein